MVFGEHAKGHATGHFVEGRAIGFGVVHAEGEEVLHSVGLDGGEVGEEGDPFVLAFLLLVVEVAPGGRNTVRAKQYIY